MNWNVTRDQDKVAVGNFSTVNAYQDGPSKFITRLLLRRFNNDYLISEVP